MINTNSIPAHALCTNDSIAANALYSSISTNAISTNSVSAYALCTDYSVTANALGTNSIPAHDPCTNDYTHQQNQY